MSDLIKFLRTSTSSAYNKVAADRIEALERDYKEACNEAADCYTKQCVAEAKLTKAVKALEKLNRRGDALETFDNVVHEIVTAALAELEGGE
jgi:hypothetical protein